ncbi:serine/threonine-protein kinase (plasmid) [Pseudarthrobacter sp. P1]|uniref:serine/threonine-protein kinase n=1 Tax=Pseudarthrobacter sp. P1 TaxID=3418418 RepID=UPI003CF75078
MQIKLDRTTWTRGQALPDGEGGFGKVYFASNSETKDAVAKFVKKSPGATREMLIGEYLRATECTNVVPVLDSGEHEDAWVIVMPRAEMSLAERLGQAEPVELAECLKILDDVAQALASLDGRIVHRDLKPGNVLLLDGKWCLADFGIARYADATTAADTRKNSLTLPYAAPEQWLSERAVAATDVYAFGVMAYQLVAGCLPFTGPAAEDFRDQHLKQLPPQLTGGTSRLRNIISECLTKAPGARPTAANIVSRLKKSTIEPALAGIQRLAAMSTEAASLQAQEHANKRMVEVESERRARLFESAVERLTSFVQPLMEEIEDNAPTASIRSGDRKGEHVFTAELMGATLRLGEPQREWVWNGPFDVIGAAKISVFRAKPDMYGWRGRSHSLWFCDAQTAGHYDWYEMAFMGSVFSRSHPDVEPFASNPEETKDEFSTVVGGGQLAWPVAAIDRDDPSEFISRWLGWFADASAGTLGRPSTMPELSPQGTWRRS